MKKITLLICLMLCGLFVVGGATASAAGKKPMDKELSLIHISEPTRPY